MHALMKLLLCFSLMPAGASSQEQTKQVMVGRHGDQVRVVVAFMNLTEEGYKLQSLIIDLSPARNSKEPPSSVQVDLTSTLRSLATGKKQQQILVLRWKKPGELELKCEGKWAKRDMTAALNEIVETTQAVIRSVPLDAKSPTEVTLPPEVEQKVTALLDSLKTADLPCLRDGK